MLTYEHLTEPQDSSHPRRGAKFMWCIAAYCLVLLAAASAPVALQAQVDVTTNRYNGARSGANVSEAALTPAGVDLSHFGKLYSYPVDGAVYAQPLYVTNVLINGVAHNVLYVVTMNDKVYAFDADSALPTPLWTTGFTRPPTVIPVPIADISNGGNIYNNVGIESTPVIDRTAGPAGTLYLVARTKEDGTYVQRVHALDIATGLDRLPSVTIAASVRGSAADSTIDATGQRVITFDPKLHQQRAALALSNGVVLVAWASHEDLPPYHGWIMGFDAATLAPVGALAVTPDVYGGGIWQGGRAPALDAAGNAYFATGNATWDGVRNFGDSLLKVSVSRTGLGLLGFFTPENEATLNAGDDDLSGSGFTLLPGTNLLLGGGKEGVLYLLNSDNLGSKQTGDPQVVQKIFVNGGHVMGGPVFWTSAAAGTLVFNWSETDVLTSYQLKGGLLTGPYAQGVVVSPGHPGGSLTVTANGSTAHTGIVWASMPTSENAKHVLTAGILRAYDAETLQELWTSEENPGRDRVGTLVKFVPPLVDNGRVYMATQDNAVAVYGLLAPATTSASEIVLHARDAQPIAGTWHLVTDTTAAGGARIEQPDAGVPKITTPSATPADYFELTFTARANTQYRLWMRARALNDSYANDSVYVQFSGSVTDTGTPVNRIGTTEATTFVLEDCSGCGEAGWGWQDDGYGTGVLGPLLYFVDGPQTIRVQAREDGLGIDQIVLSPGLYLNTSPGVTKNDTTILAESVSNQSPAVSLTSPTDGATVTAGADVTVSASASDRDGTVAKVDLYMNDALISTGTSAPYSTALRNLAAGIYRFKAMVTDNQGATATSTVATITVTTASGGGLPTGWIDADVGPTGAPGSATFQNGTFAVQGAGGDVWGTSDAFNYAYVPLTGDGTIVARVATVSSEANWLKAGVMIRGSLSPSSAQAFMLVSHAKGLAFQRRTADGLTSVNTSGIASTAPYWVKLVRAASTISAYESADGSNWTLVGSDTFRMPDHVLIGLAVSSHVSGTLATATFDGVKTQQLPDGWADADIGSVPFRGSASYKDGTFTVTGSGADIWGTADAFNYAYRPLTGNGTIVAQVTSVDHVAAWVKAGVMIRESSDPGSPQAFVLVSSARGVAFQRRQVAGGASVNTAGSASTPPHWVKLTRAGDMFTAYESNDGATWVPIGSDTIPMAPTIYIGLAGTSHSLSSSAVSSFRNVRIE
jgi:regulation of enolase protein 1 (concanavalin A-like superfamily)